jgi:integrase
VEEKRPKSEKCERTLVVLADGHQVTEAEVRRVPLYDARHACLTYLATSGVPDVVVSAWAGHADISFTKRVYVHPDIEHLREAASQLDQLLGQQYGRT